MFIFVVLQALFLLSRTQKVPFNIPQFGSSANGFAAPAHGWNSFGLQAADSKLKSGAGWDFNDYHIRQQCDLIAVKGDRDYYCSIDSGWSVGCNGDANGVPYPDTKVIPNITDLASHLHRKGLKLGIYVLPGAFSSDRNKVVKGTSIEIGSLFNQSDPGYNCRQNFDYSNKNVQVWHDSVVAQFIEWGIDFIKLDYITPGSPQTGESLPADSSGAVTAYHQAIKNNQASIRLVQQGI
jgi:alpha-galactosidase